jgi:hypothetical protein
MREDDILYETPFHYVIAVKNGFEVYSTGLTHATRCAQIGYKGEKGLKRAKEEINRRELCAVGGVCS